MAKTKDPNVVQHLDLSYVFIAIVVIALWLSITNTDEPNQNISNQTAQK